MVDDFDPYLQWLGIRDPQRPPNFYRLLGVELFEQDPIVLTHAADRQMAHVRIFQTGQHALQSQQILNELAAAKLCLLNAQRKAEYDAWLRAELAAAYPVQAAPIPVTPEYRGVAYSEPAQPSYEPAASSPEPISPLVKAVIGVLSGLILLLIALILWVSTRSPEVAAKPQPVPSQPSPVAGAPAKPDLGTKGTESGKPEARTTGADSQPPVEANPQPAAKPEGKPEPPPTEKPPAAKPAEVPPDKIPPAADSLRAARTAIKRRDLTAAVQQLDLAEKAAEPETRTEIDRLREALGPLGAFWRAVQAGIGDLKPGETLDVGGGHQVTVSSSTADTLIVKDGKWETRYTVSNLPAALALVIAERKLPDVPSSKLSKAAFMTFDPRGDRKLARQWCDEATRDGLPTTALMAELGAGGGEAKPAPTSRSQEEKGTARQAIPAPADQAKALAEVRKIHRDDFEEAVDRVKRKSLAKSLFKEGVDTKDDPVVRFVLLNQARDLAVAAGDPDLLRKALDETAKHYDVNPQQQLISILLDVAESRVASGGKKELSRGAVDLAEELIDSDNYEDALKLARAAQTMALGRDSATTKRATDLVKVLPHLKLEYERFQQAAKVLAQDPNNAAANLAQGKYYCFVKDSDESWEMGLPLLAKGGDAKLKALAEAEMATAKKDDAGELFNLAEQWYDVSRSVDAASREGCLNRAAYWYKKALPELQGFKQKKAKLRLEELNATE
jgi:hypothetical protein